MKMSVRFAVCVILLAAIAAVLAPARVFADKPQQGPAAPADVATVPADAEKSDSGLAWKVLKPGHGKVHPNGTDTVTVGLEGWTATGRIFMSSTVAKKPTISPLNQIIVPGLVEGIQKMTVGEKRRFWVPNELAFNSAPGKPQGMCVFEVDLMDIKAAPQGAGKTYPAPPDVAKAPADAQVTKSGLASKVIKPGTGKVHPTSFSTVTVHYILWTPNGHMIETSRDGAPATFPLNRVIAGWTEGVQLMVEGETRRFWIPGNLAYGDKPTRPGAPAGPLVFDVELIKIEQQ